MNPEERTQSVVLVLGLIALGVAALVWWMTR